MVVGKMMHAKCVRVLRQNRQAQDSASEKRPNRASRPIVKFPGVSLSGPSFGDTVKERIKVEKGQQSSRELLKALKG